MEFLLLGPLEVRDSDGPIPLGGAKQRALLASLLLHANEVLSRDRLIDGLWGAQPPATAAHTVETYVSRLRRALHDAGSDAALVTRAPGYLLRVDPQRLDLTRFGRLAGDGRRALAEANPELAAELLREALALFRGPPLDDVAFLCSDVICARRVIRSPRPVLISRRAGCSDALLLAESLRGKS